MFQRRELDAEIRHFRTFNILWLLIHPSTHLWVEPGRDISFFTDFSGHRLNFPPNVIPAIDYPFATSYLHQAITHLIFDNHSFTITLHHKNLSLVCGPQIAQENNALPNISYTEAPKTDFLLAEEFTPFRFVSCGGQSRTNQVFSFSSFYNCFDISTWVGIFLIYFVIAATLQTGGVDKIPNTFFTSFAILVEQSQRGCTVLWNELSRLFLYGALILGGIYLSNAYKGDNITRLTLPAISLPYEKLKELMTNNFKMYTLENDIYNLAWSFSITFPPMMSLYGETNLLRQVETVDETWLWQKLAACTESQGIALFTTEGKVFDYAAKLRNFSHISREDVGVGKEKYSGVWRGLRMSNNVDPRIPERVTRYFETGITKQWLKMWFRRFMFKKVHATAGYEHFARNERERKMIRERYLKAKVWQGLVLNGSILTLFVGLCGSYLLSLAVFAIELLMKRIKVEPHWPFLFLH